MNNIRYVFKFFINPLDSCFNVQNILNYSKFVSNNLNTSYTELGYCFSISNQTKNKRYTYTQDNLEKLNNQSNIISVFFDRLKKKKYYFDTDLSLDFLFSDKEDYPAALHISIDPKILNERSSSNDLQEFIKKTLSFGFQIDYGIVHLIEEKKMPMYFLIGLKTPELNQEERDMDDALTLNIREYKKKIWDIFWINIINKELIDNILLKNITEVVNEKNVVEIGNKYIITLPLNLNEYVEEKEKTDIYKNKLRKIFADADKIMYKPI